MPNKYVLLLARILLSVMFILSGQGKFHDGGATVGMIEQAGLPAAVLLGYLAGAFELLAGLAILVGLQTRIVAYLLAAFCVFTGFVFHAGAINVPGFPDVANQMLSIFNQIMFMKNLALAGGFLALASVGAGALSVDGRKAA
jgi:putative oxidoreductase